MSQSNKKSAKLSAAQREMLIKFMIDNPRLIRGKLDSTFSLQDRQHLWSEIILHLNSAGPSKSQAQWRKTWSDLKCSAKNKAATIRKQLSKAGSDPTLCTERLSDLEERILKLMEFYENRDTIECMSESVVKIEPPDDIDDISAKYETNGTGKQLNEVGDFPVQHTERMDKLERKILKVFDNDQHHYPVKHVSENVEEIVVKVEPQECDESDEAADDSHATMFLEDMENSGFGTQEFRVEVSNPEVQNVYKAHQDQNFGVIKVNEENTGTKNLEPVGNNENHNVKGNKDLSPPEHISAVENSAQEPFRDQGLCDPVVESKMQEVDVPHEKRILPEEISDVFQESKRTRFEGTDFLPKKGQPMSQVFDTAINVVTSAINPPQGFEIAVNALTSAINKYVELRKLEISMKERKLLLKVKQLKTREKLARAMERIADAKEKQAAS